MTWSVRPADPGDAARIEAFLLTVQEFKGTISAGEERQIWSWLFSAGSLVDGSYLAEDQAGAVVGHYGNAPWPFWADGQKVTAGLLCKLGIDERYRRTPLFMRLSQEVLRQCFHGGGPEFSLGMVNRPGVLPFHLAFGFARIGDIPVYAKPLRLDRIARSTLSSRSYHWVRIPSQLGGRLLRSLVRLWSMRPSGPHRVTRVFAFGPEFDSVDALLSRYRYRAIRSSDMLTRRYLQGPSRGYEPFRIDGPDGLAGYFVLRRMQMKDFDALAIVDVCLDPRDTTALGVVLRFVDRLALDRGVDLISVLAGSVHLRRALRRGLYLKTPESFTLIVHAAGSRSRVPERMPELGVVQTAISDWYVTWHDNDYV